MAQRPQKKLFSRKKVCRFCSDKEQFIDYKDVKTLRGFVSERGKSFLEESSGPAPRTKDNSVRR